MRIHFIVTNIDKTTQRVMDWQGQMRFIEPNKSILMHNPPKESYIFHIEPLTHEAEKIYFEEFKTEGSELKTVAEEKELKAEEKLKKKEVKK
jgi:hypothetical protein